MHNIKRLWKIFKYSSARDRDMQKAFNRAATPNACIDLLEENEALKSRIDDINNKLTGYVWFQRHEVKGLCKEQNGIADLETYGINKKIEGLEFHIERCKKEGLSYSSTIFDSIVELESLKGIDTNAT
jgi:hypothetical protein